MGSESGAEVRRRRIEKAFAEAEESAKRTQVVVVMAAIAVIVPWITVENGFPGVLFYYAFLLAFGLIVASPLLLGHRRPLPAWEPYVRFLFAVVLYTVMTLTPNPFVEDFRTGPMLMRWHNEIYFGVFIVASAFTYSPWVVLSTGFGAALSWSLGALWVSRQPGVITGVRPEIWGGMAPSERAAALMDPHFLYIAGVQRVDLVLLLFSVLVAALVHRLRQIVLRQAEAERERANLSRYFSPNQVEELAQSDVPLSTTRRQDAAVLFVDLVGFTGFSARHEPELVIETLRQFHHRVERAVFAHGGTLEKYIGDGAMATFGTPRTAADDARRALLCVGTLLASLNQWNAERVPRGGEAIRAGIGVHYGPVVLGDIGGEQRLEFAVIGDTVNVASRLEHLTREIGAAAVVSGELVDAIEREGGEASALLPALTEAPSRGVRGRDEPLRLWIVPA